MTIALLLFTFIVISGCGCLYDSYRKKVPTPYDLCIDEFAPKGAIHFTCGGKEILFHEGIFVFFDLRFLRRSGFVCCVEFFDKDGKRIEETPEFMRAREKHRLEFIRAFSENSGEAEVDRRLLSATAFFFRRTSFSPKRES